MRRVAEGEKSDQERLREEEEYAKFIADARRWTAYDPEAVGNEKALPPWEEDLRDAREALHARETPSTEAAAAPRK